MAQQQAEIRTIADNPAAPTFDNTIVALEKSGRLLDRATAVFFGVTGANINPTLQNVKTIEAPKLAAHQDFLFLNTKLFARIAALYKERGTLDSMRSRCGCWSATTTISCTRAPISRKPTRRR